MTQVVFHFNVADKLAYSCRLLRKAYRSGAKAVVLAEADLLAQLDAMLWTFSATEFIPHCRWQANALTRAASPVLLVSDLAHVEAALLADKQVLVNLGLQAPPDLRRFARVMDVVTRDPQDRAAARQRWKYVESLGLTPQGHDLTATGVAA